MHRHLIIPLLAIPLLFVCCFHAETGSVKADAMAAKAATSQAGVDLTGRWLPDESPIRPDWVMGTGLEVTENRFVLHGYRELKANWTGSFELGAKDNQGQIEIQSNGISFKERGMSSDIPPCRLPGIWKLDGNRITICFGKTKADSRPARFEEGEHSYLISFVRTPAGWSGFPKTVKITVLDPAGKPDPGAILFGYVSREQPSTQRADGKWYIDMTQPATFSSSASLRGDEPENLDAGGTAVVPYARFEQQIMPFGARDEEHGWIGITPVSPAILQHGALTIQMHPQHTVRGMIAVSGERPASEKPPWRAAYLTALHSHFAFCAAPDGAFEFQVPPGTYSLYTYGNDLVEQTREITVTAGEGDIVVPPITLQASTMLALIGKPAPELVKVKAWKNGPVSLADLKGKVVLLDFWGYWCGNCVVDMPNLFRLYDKYKDKGLVIVGVHIDEGGDVDTVEKLDARTKMYRDGIWKGRDIPFPVAICSGEDNHTDGNPVRYGVPYYPTTIVIDRSGKVLGAARQQLPFDLNDEKEADAAIEKLLADPK
jgi:uncharacterized protein (TIGR03067 family)